MEQDIEEVYYCRQIQEVHYCGNVKTSEIPKCKIYTNIKFTINFLLSKYFGVYYYHDDIAMENNQHMVLSMTEKMALRLHEGVQEQTPINNGRKLQIATIIFSDEDFAPKAFPKEFVLLQEQNEVGVITKTNIFDYIVVALLEKTIAPIKIFYETKLDESGEIDGLKPWESGEIDGLKPWCAARRLESSRNLLSEIIMWVPAPTFKLRFLLEHVTEKNANFKKSNHVADFNQGRKRDRAFEIKKILERAFVRFEIKKILPELAEYFASVRTSYIENDFDTYNENQMPIFMSLIDGKSWLVIDKKSGETEVLASTKEVYYIIKK